MFTATVNNNTFKLNIGKEIQVDGQTFDLDLAKLSEGKYHLISDNKSYAVELVAIDKEGKTLEIKVNNTVYEVALKDRMDELLEQLGMDTLQEAKTEDLKAPMPGLILEISVEVGQKIAKGDKLLVLEAMKMENVIKAASDGVVVNVNVEVGHSVDNGQVLINLS